MGSTGSGAGDYSIGPIVWVRRRNGSWWPGKILGPDELAECNLTSPRTGTPVKLLGREDASVDWYNLEKSKRVKAFRCGEFDDCIERAEAAQGMPIKKREKYARREDAIFHALELEKELLRKQGKLGGTDHPRSKSSGPAKEPVIASEGMANNDTGKTGITKLNQVLNRMDTNVKDEIVCNSVKTKDEHQPISEDDHSEATPRMRGLQDLGLRTASLKRKNASPVRSDGSEKPMVDNHQHAHTVAASSMERTNHGNGGEQMGAVSRAKRSKCIYFPTETNDSLDDKEHPPNQIKMFEDNGGHPHNGSFNEQNSSSGFMEDIESDDSSETDSSESESDSSETEPDVDDEMAIYPDACMHLEAERNVFRQPEAREHETTSSEDPDEYAFSSEMRHIYPDDPFFANEAVSKWQLKGKRNIRHLTRRSANRAAGRKALNAIPREIYHRIRGSSSRQRAYGVGDTDFDRENFGSQMFPLDNGHYSYKPRFVSKGRNTGHYAIDWRDLTWEDRPTLKGRLEDRANHFNPSISGRHHFTGRTRSILVDVDLKVQASYQKERVPIVSLLSKLNGKAIIGHPIQIESLEDGSSENLVSTNDYPSMEMFDHEEIAPVPPAWRTARRTNFRVPRSHLSSVLGEDVVEDPGFMDQDGRSSPIRKSSMGGFNNKASLVRKSLPQTSRPPVDRKIPRKLPKKSSLSFNQKTRTLSSIAVQQNFGTKHMHYGSGSQMDGLLKPETGRPTAVACIPVKLVFSRLLEKINRPPSKAACKVVMSTRETERQPS